MRQSLHQHQSRGFRDEQRPPAPPWRPPLPTRSPTLAGGLTPEHRDIRRRHRRDGSQSSRSARRGESTLWRRHGTCHREEADIQRKEFLARCGRQMAPPRRWPKTHGPSQEGSGMRHSRSRARCRCRRCRRRRCACDTTPRLGNRESPSSAGWRFLQGLRLGSWEKSSRSNANFGNNDSKWRIEIHLQSSSKKLHIYFKNT